MRTLSALRFGWCLAFAGMALAQEAKPDFSFHIDPIRFGFYSSEVDTNSSKFEEYSDLSSGFIVPLLNLEASTPNGSEVFSFRAVNLKREDARYAMEFDRAGKFRLRVVHNLIPHRFGNDGRLLWNETSPGRLEISDSTQAALQNAIATQWAISKPSVNYNFLNGLISPYVAAAQKVDLGLRRDRSEIRFDTGGLGKFSFGVDLQREQRRGTRPIGGSFGFSNAVELPEPIDYTTQSAELKAEWRLDRGGIAFGYKVSKFENHVDALIFDNPFRRTDATDPSAYTAPGAGSIGGSSTGVIDLPADNRAGSAWLMGRVKFGKNWFFQGNAARTDFRQNDGLLPYTFNSAIVGINFDSSTFDPTSEKGRPSDTAQRKATTTTLNADLGTRFLKHGSFAVRYRYYQYDNNSPRFEFPGYVRYHAVWEAIGRVTVPYAYDRETTSAELGWDLPGATHIAVSDSRETMNRDFREISKATEDTSRITLDHHPVSWFTLRGSFSTAKRTIGAYHTQAMEDSFIEPEGITNQAKLRKYDEAARDRDNMTWSVQFDPGEAWSIETGVTWLHDRYPDSRFGLDGDKIAQYNAELSYNGKSFGAYAFTHHADRHQSQRGRQSGAVPSTNRLDNWDASFKEKTDTYGLGFDASLGKRWKAHGESTWSKSDGAVGLSSPPGGTPNLAFGFDNYEDVEFSSLKLKLGYTVGPHSALDFGYRHDEYTIDSFIRQGLKNYLPGALILNADNGDFLGSIYWATMRMSF